MFLLLYVGSSIVIILSSPNVCLLSKCARPCEMRMASLLVVLKGILCDMNSSELNKSDQNGDKEILMYVDKKLIMQPR
jgi:hypothetical protein